jgi:HlyD family secretion protein
MTDPTTPRSLFPWQLLRRAILPVVAIGLIGAAALTISRPPAETTEPRIAPPTPAEGRTDVVAALGILEPSSEIISLSADVSGLIAEVLVEPGELVAAGAPLLRIDGRASLAVLAERQAAITAASATAATRTGDITAAEAAVSRALASAEAGSARAAEAQAGARAASLGRERARVALADAEARLGLVATVREADAVSRDEIDRARFAVEQARLALAEASASAERVSAAARVAAAEARAQEAAVREARAVRDRTRAARATDQAGIRQAQAAAGSSTVAIDRLVVRAPIAGTILRVEARAGEFATAGGAALIQMGQTSPLHVRLEIDEEDAQRVRAGAPAEGSLRSDATRRIPLTFVRFEPLATPKQNLAGGAERVDTRVVEAIYALDPARVGLAEGRVFIGQQLDVFITAEPLAVPPVAPAPANGAEQ